MVTQGGRAGRRAHLAPGADAVRKGWCTCVNVFMYAVYLNVEIEVLPFFKV
jgi:hypothetical protein